MNDDYTAPDCDDEAPANFWNEEAYRAGQGAAAQGTKSGRRDPGSRTVGAPFGGDERAALVEGYWDRIAFERDMRDENDKPRAA